MKKKVLVTGACGQLGYDLVKALISRGFEVIATDVFDGLTQYKNYLVMDITSPDEIRHVFQTTEPDFVIHCAAWTAVDNAELPCNVEKVDLINHVGTKFIAEACKAIGATMVYISTDYVFSGNGILPWTPDCKDFAPQNVYGKTKLLGEVEVSKILEKYFIVRISWVFGKNGNNFVKTMLNLAKKYKEIKVVDDQIGTPTYTADLAHILIDMIETDKYGYYHVTNEGGFISWYDFAKEIFKQTGLKINVIPVSTAEYGLSLAKRPLNSRMDKMKLVENGFNVLPDWKNALSRFLLESQN